VAPKKKLKSIATSTSRDQVARGKSSLPYVVNKYGIEIFYDDYEKSHDAIISIKIYAPNYLDKKMLATLHLLDDLCILLAD